MKPAAPTQPPVFLTLAEASAYVGVSPDVFRAELAAGLWPRPIARGVKGGKDTWHREALDRAARILAGLEPVPVIQASAEHPAPANEDRLPANDRAVVERLRAKTQNRA